MLVDKEQIQKFYERLPQRILTARRILGRPLTYSEKIICAHMLDIDAEQKRGCTTLRLFPDRVALQDATAQMAILQFMLTGKKEVTLPTTIHCDHLISAQQGASEDLSRALQENQEVYQFLTSAANKYGIGFWKPGAGIIHQILLENYAFPGGMLIGTDSHTPNAGGLGMLAIGVGGADAVDAMAGEGCMITLPRIIGVHLRGKIHGWTAPKDVILKLTGMLTVKGGTGAIIEYFGEGTASVSCTGKATITNMGAELGATTSVFSYDDHMAAYLRATGREDIAVLANHYKQWLQPDPEVLEHPDAYYDTIIEIDLSSLEPYVVGPHTPDLARPISQLAREVKENTWPIELSCTLIGSCTNSSYEDLSRAAHIAQQALAHGLKVQSPLLVTPGSEQIYQTIQRDGILHILQQAGATLLANACGPCIGQWNRPEFKDKPNSILTSYNRNFKQRNDGNATTHAFIASPEIVTAIAFAGTLTFNPLTDALIKEDGTHVLFEAPHSEEVPAQGFVSVWTGYQAPTGEGEVLIDEKSDRLQVLTPFPKWDCREDFLCLKVLVKAAGKCTTDHISPAGTWLRYRGHLDHISDNLFCGVTNAFRQEVGRGKNQMTLAMERFATIARDYKQHNIGWIAVGDENYGEGSSREHAAMEPRYLGCRAILAKSFARIAETNLKKQGILPLWFTHPEDYEKVQEDDVITFPDLQIAEFAPITLVLKHSDGSLDTLQTTHTLNSEQVQWFYAGSALNYFREKEQQRSVKNTE